MHNYKVLFSDRKTVSIQIDENCEIIVRAPKGFSRAKIKQFVYANSDWIEKNLKKQTEKSVNKIELTQADIVILKDLAKSVLTSKTAYFASVMNVKYDSVKITSAQKRFGSCSGNNKICYSYMLMLYPDKAIDYVVIHELSHTVHHNHSKQFYDFVSEFMPDYREAEKLLQGRQKLPY